MVCHVAIPRVLAVASLQRAYLAVLPRARKRYKAQLVTSNEDIPSAFSSHRLDALTKYGL